VERLVKSFLLDVNQVQMVVKATKGCKVFAMQESFSTFIVVWFVVLGVKGDTLAGNCQKVSFINAKG
jgi:hypothetical protein